MTKGRRAEILLNSGNFLRPPPPHRPGGSKPPQMSKNINNIYIYIYGTGVGRLKYTEGTRVLYGSKMIFTTVDSGATIKYISQYQPPKLIGDGGNPALSLIILIIIVLFLLYKRKYIEVLQRFAARTGNVGRQPRKHDNVASTNRNISLPAPGLRTHRGSPYHPSRHPPNTRPTARTGVCDTRAPDTSAGVARRLGGRTHPKRSFLKTRRMR